MKNKTFSPLNIEEQQALLGLARKTLETHLQSGEVYRPVIENIPQRLQEPQSCFVTYKHQHELRGCIGSIYPQQPLFLEVIDKAILAASEDNRFSPIELEELPHIHIDITVLSPPQPIQEYTEFEPGKHGIILYKNNCSAVFLPQVAVEQNWTREQTLKHLSLKAGLTSEAWKSGADLQIFTAQVIQE